MSAMEGEQLISNDTAVRLAVLISHPIQYYSPVFRLLTDRGVHLKVFYCHNPSVTAAYDPGFGREVEWDIPLLDGYESQFLPNVARKPGSYHFGGLDNPTAIAELKRWQPTHILLFGWKHPTHLRVLWSFRNSACLLFRGDSNLLDERRGWKTLLRRFVLRQVYRFVDAALFVGSANRRYYEIHGLKSHQLYWVPHSVDHSRFKASRQPAYSDGVVRFLFIGKLQPKKAPDLLLDAARCLVAQGYSDFQIVFVGDGEMRGLLEQQSKGISQIVWKGFVNQKGIPAEYEACNVVVLPSRGPEETWGLVINEAFACGKPAIVSNKVGCAEDLVKPGYTGYVFDSENPDALAECLRHYLDQRQLCKTHGNAAWQLIRAWSIEAQCDRIIECLRATAGTALSKGKTA